MKAITSELQSLLNSRGALFRADLISIALPNGDALNVTNQQIDVTWGGTTYYATQYGAWDRGRITSKADFSLASESMALTLLAEDSVLFPSTTTPMMQVIFTGILDAAKVTISTVYGPVTKPSEQNAALVGAMTTFAGTLVDIKRLGRSKAQFAVQDWNYLLNLKIPQTLVQPGCGHILFDTGCALSSANFAFANTAAAGSGGIFIYWNTAIPSTDSTGGSTASPYFAQGKLQWTSGQNKGLWSAIVSQGTNGVVLQTAPVFPVGVGDGFTAYPGCDKRQSTCSAKFKNLAHFNGTPYVPPPEQSI